MRRGSFQLVLPYAGKLLPANIQQPDSNGLPMQADSVPLLANASRQLCACNWLPRFVSSFALNLGLAP
jgi:hypothetical protein